MTQEMKMCMVNCVKKGKRKLICHGMEGAKDWDAFFEMGGYEWGEKLREFLSGKVDGRIAAIQVPDKWAESLNYKYAVAVEVEISYDERLPKEFQILDYLLYGDMLEIEILKKAGLTEKEWRDEIVSLQEIKSTYPLESYGYAESPSEAPVFYYMELDGKVKMSCPITRTELGDKDELERLNQISKEELYRTAYYDDITGCHNWNWMVYKMYHFREEGIREFSFVHFDIKDFKQVNENFGTEKADSLLRFVGKTLSENRSWIYHFVRCDNDNFAMMIKPMTKGETRERLENLFCNMQSAPFEWDYPVFYRCGVVLQDITMSSVSVMVNLAKLAQRQGSSLPEHDINFYTVEMHEEYLRNKKLRSEIDRALENDEFTIYLQPKYNAETEELSGAEALARWNYKKEKILTPARFVPFMEKDGSICKIDELVLRKSCEKLREWKEKGLPLLPISVNISRVQLKSANLVEKLCRIVKEYGVDFGLIDFELTESVAYDNTEYMVDIMCQLRNRGFRLSMDDFGTGFSSLSLLKDMPLDTLKIDKSFVDGIVNGSSSHKEQWIVKDIITMANHMKIVSLAEGAETYEQKEMLRKWGCQYIQGYYYSKPLPILEYEKLLKKEWEKKEEFGE